MPSRPISPPSHCTFADSDWNILSLHWFPVAVASELRDRPEAARPMASCGGVRFKCSRLFQPAWSWTIRQTGNCGS
jgi:hypothetical protein